MPVRQPLLLVALLLGLSGCATLSRNECRVADWYNIGYEDGLRGQTAVRISEHRKACADAGVSPDLDRYLQGREAGLQGYCDPGNGFRLGLRDRAYTGVCPAQAEAAFLASWSAGKAIHDSEVQLRRLDRILATNREQLESLARDGEATEAELVQRGTTLERRATLLLELHELAATRDMVENEIREIELAIAREREQLAVLRQNAGHRGATGQTSRR